MEPSRNGYMEYKYLFDSWMHGKSCILFPWWGAVLEIGITSWLQRPRGVQINTHACMQELCTLSAGYLPCFVFIFILHAFANHNEIILAYLLQRMSVKIFFLSRKMSQFHSCCFNFMWTQCLSIIYFSLLVNLRCLIYFRLELEIYF